MRECLYKGEFCKWHGFYQEGNWGGDHYGGITIQSGEIKVVALLEMSSGKIQKISDVENITLGNDILDGHN